MDFKPFQPPPSEYHSLNTGLSNENGTSAKGLIEGINGYFAHLFAAISGGVAEPAESDLSARVTALEDAVAALQIRLDAAFAPADPNGKPAEVTEPSAPPTEPIS